MQQHGAKTKNLVQAMKGKATAEAEFGIAQISAPNDGERRFRALLESVKDYAIFMLDANGCVVDWNSCAGTYLDYWSADISGQPLNGFYAPEDIENCVPAKHLALARREGRVEDRGWRVRKDGARFWAEVVLTALTDEHDSPCGFSHVIRDVSERREAEEAVGKLAAFARFDPNPLMEFDMAGKLIFCNDAARKMAAALDAGEPLKLLPPDFAEIIKECLATEKDKQDIEATVDKRTLAWSFFPVAASRTVHAHAFDITERKRVEEQLLHDAFHDALTGLPNRALFMDHLKLAIERARRHENRVFAVLLLDLDRFKIINDSLGHLVGDQMLVAMARRLEGTLRPGDTVARFGGDEFTILLEDINSASEVVRVAERVQAESMLPFCLGRHEVFTSASIGVTLSTNGYTEPEDLLRDADTAMYRAKSLGKARHEIFDVNMHASAKELLHLETDLRRAIERKELRVFYQPIMPLEGDKLCGFEALVRWQHPERGLVTPADFVPIAEETGLIIPIGQWVLGEACRQMSCWQKEFGNTDRPLSISVNLCSKQFTQPDLIEQITGILEATKLDPRSLKLEITESVVMENTETAMETLLALRALGVELDIDDFGTGYSSLSYLHHFPVGTLKIDRSFVSRMDGNDNGEIVQTIIMLAHNLGIEVVAEGVETKEQLTQLRQLECKYGQGYFFSRPVDADTASTLITQNLSM